MTEKPKKNIFGCKFPQNLSNYHVKELGKFRLLNIFMNTPPYFVIYSFHYLLLFLYLSAF